MPEPIVREGVPRTYTDHPEGILDVWIDWSGYSAVAVCPLCGLTEFAGLTTGDGISVAAAHRKAHPELAGSGLSHIPFIHRPLCGWGYTYWGEGLGEMCNVLPRAGDYCGAHTSRIRDLYERGTCREDGCYKKCAERQPVCTPHASLWARAHGLEPFRVGPRGSVSIP